MTDTFAIAASGLAAASLGLESAASNIANMQSVGAVPGTPPGRELAGFFQPTQPAQTALPGGGTKASLVSSRPSCNVIYDPSSYAANGEGMVAVPAVDPAKEVANLRLMTASYSANLQSLRALDRQIQALIEVMA